MRRIIAGIFLATILFSGCKKDEDKEVAPTPFTVEITEKSGVKIVINGQPIEIKFGDSFDAVKGKLPGELDISDGRIEFYQLTFNFKDYNGGYSFVGGLNSITVFSPEKSWKANDAFRLASFTTNSGLVYPTFTRDDVIRIYGEPDENSGVGKREKYYDEDLIFFFDDNIFHYMYVKDDI